jgi:hypothetical protein
MKKLQLFFELISLVFEILDILMNLFMMIFI